MAIYSDTGEWNFNVVEYEDDNFPIPLKEDYMKGRIRKLYYRGNLSILRAPCAAVVGSRNISSYGRWVGENLGKKLAENGVTVVSELARGMDSQAHRGCLKSGGKTVAVLGCGIDICYPSDNFHLKGEIEKTGLVISQFPPGTKPMKYNFPMRNEIIAALSKIVVVGEAGINSGAGITAELAAEQGKTVMAVPGNINTAFSLGTNKLIQEGAVMVANLDEVLREMGIEPVALQSVNKDLGSTEMKIYKILSERGELTLDELCERSSMVPGKVMGIITVLEMKGVVATARGRAFLI